MNQTDFSRPDSIGDTCADHSTAHLAVLHQWIAAINQRDLSNIDALIAEHIVDHHLPPGIPAGRAGVALWCGLLGDALQMQITLEDTVVQGDRIAVRATISGRHIGAFGGLAATNRTFVASMMSIERFEHGCIVERWENVDSASIMQQLTG